MKEDVYARLQRHMDAFIMHAPESDSFLEILRIRFSPEEAEVALLLNQIPQKFFMLAESAGRSTGDLRVVLAKMADKALVFRKIKRTDGGKKEFYSLLPKAVGSWETSFAKGEANPEREQLANYWREYYLDGWGKSMFGAKVPFYPGYSD